MNDNINNLGDLIKSKGFLMYYVRDELNKRGINCNKATFSRWCTMKRRPQNPASIVIIADMINEDIETVKKYLKK